MAEEKIPVNWYAVVETEPHSIEPYLATFELLAEPQLLPFEQDGRKLGKLTSSGFAGYADYEGVLKEARELISVLTGTLRIRQGPGPLSIIAGGVAVVAALDPFGWPMAARRRGQ